MSRTPVTSVPASTDQKKDDGAEEFEPDVDFQPVIPLPELVETPTGEEREDLLFSHRAKLFRFVSLNKVWKERGVGEFKILRNPETGKVRFLMRREQVLKICCNHHLSPSMDFKPLSSSDTAWTWTAPDFSEGEIVNELLAVRFKTPELAQQWKKIVEDCQKKLAESPPVKSPTRQQSEVAEVAEVVPSLARFASEQKKESWECRDCLTRNQNSNLQCLACQVPKSGVSDPATTTSSQSHGFSFTKAPEASIGPFSFTPLNQNPTAPTSLPFSFKPETVKPNGNDSTAQTFSFTPFSFGSSTGSTTEAAITKDKVEKVKTVEVENIGSLSSPGFRFSGVKTNNNPSQGLGPATSDARKPHQTKSFADFSFDWVGSSATKATTETSTAIKSPSSKTFKFSGVNNASKQVNNIYNIYCSN